MPPKKPHSPSIQAISLLLILKGGTIMNQKEEEIIEYEKCKLKILKAWKDVDDAIKELSTENLKRLKREMSIDLIPGLNNFIKFLRS